MELLRDHDSPHDGVDEEGEQDVAQEDEDPHQDADKQLLRGLHHLPVEAHQSGHQPHGQIARLEWGRRSFLGSPFKGVHYFETNFMPTQQTNEA